MRPARGEPGRTCRRKLRPPRPPPWMEPADMTPGADRTPFEADKPMMGCEAIGDVPRARRAGHPLGPLVSMTALDRPLVGRLYAVGLAAAAGAVLATAASLTPSESYMGTHQQLRISRHPCGFVLTTGFPCPTCGMTTAFAHAVRGQFLRAARSQAAGFLLAFATAGTAVFGVAAAVTGRRPRLNWYRVNPNHLVWWLTGLLAAAWAGKILLGLVDGSLPVR